MPSHWKLLKTKRLFERVQRPVKANDGVVTAFRDGQVTLRSKRRTDGFTNAEKEIGYQGVRVGDLVVHAMDGFAGAIGVSDSAGKCSPVCSVCVPKPQCEAHVPYYGYLVRQLAVTDFIASLAKGIRERSTEFRYSEFSILSLPLPSLSEQTQIVHFLNYETARIDALIEKQQQLIVLLKEKRQAVISHAVTKGLNPNAPLRESGVEWLGLVPAHWEVLNLNRVVDTFVDYRGRTPEKIDEGRPLITAGAIKNGAVEFERSPQFVSEATYRLLRQRGVPELEDILFTSEAPLGEVALVENVEVACAQRIIMFKVNRRRIEPRYLWLYLRSQAGRDEILTKASGSTAEGIRADRLRRSRVPLPTIDEQRRICDHVRTALDGFDEILAATAAQTSLLQERRTALISAAVTGKIDVRSWAPPDSKV